MTISNTWSLLISCTTSILVSLKLVQCLVSRTCYISKGISLYLSNFCHMFVHLLVFPNYAFSHFCNKIFGILLDLLMELYIFINFNLCHSNTHGVTPVVPLICSRYVVFHIQLYFSLPLRTFCMVMCMKPFCINALKIFIFEIFLCL